MNLLILFLYLIIYNESIDAITDTNDVMVNLPNGVLISDPKTIKISKAQWQILITIQPPALIPLGPYLNSLTEMIAEVEAEGTSPHRLLRHNLEYLRTMDSQNTAFQYARTNLTSQRTRRGLINLGGKLLHHVFGVATDAQIDHCQQLIDAAMDRQSDIVNHYNELTTVVKKNQQNTIENRRLLKAVVNHFQNVVTNATNWTRQRFLQIHREMDINSFMQTLHMYTLQNIHNIDVYLQQRADLERGALTESILPKSYLQSLLAKVKRQLHLEPLEWHWYYSNININPLWQEGHNLVYITHLPFVAMNDYLMYTIQSFPVGHQNSTIQLNAQPHIAMDSTTSGLFIPSECKGHNPAVCQAGPIGYRPLYTCEHGLLTKNKEEMDTCSFTLQEHASLPSFYPIQHSHGQYVIYTNDERITKNCPGSPSQDLQMAPGTYLLTIPGQCNLQAETWTLYKLFYGIKNLNISSYTQPELFDLKLLQRLPTLRHEVQRLPTELKTIQTLRSMQINSMPTEGHYFHKIIKPHHTVITLTIIIVLVIIVIGIGIYFCKRCQNCTRLNNMFARMKLNTSSSTTTLATITTNPSNVSVYPKTSVATATSPKPLATTVVPMTSTVPTISTTNQLFKTTPLTANLPKDN